MSNKTLFTVILISVILFGCSSTNKIKMSSNPMINEIIRDYYKNNKRYIKDYSVFRFERKEMKNQELEVYTALPQINEIAYTVYLEDSLNNKYLPTHYLEYKNKLFLWREGNQKISDSVMQYIYSRKLVDSSYVKYQMGLIPEKEIQEIHITIDDGIKGVNYIFCKSDPSKIKKKITTNKYIYPDDERLQVKCD